MKRYNFKKFFIINGKKIASVMLCAVALVVSIDFSGTAKTTSGASALNVASTNSSPFAGVALDINNILLEANYTSTMALIQAQEAEATARAQYEGVAIAQVDNYVNIRTIPSEEGEVVGKLYNKSAATVLEEKDGWYKITSGNCEGYVKCEYVVVGDVELAKSVSRVVATVTAETLYIREEPSTESKILGYLPYGDDITVTSEDYEDQGWVAVSAEEGDGYVSLDYITRSVEYVTAESKEEEAARLAKEEAARKQAREAAVRMATSQNSSQKSSNKSYSAPSGAGGAAVVNYGSQFVGNPYVYGGTSLTNGTDCSGFVMGIYGAFGVSLPHSSAAMRSCGYGVSEADMQVGDIVCYSGHVGVYAGNGMLLHASTPRTGITYSPVTYRKILAVRRIY